MIARTSPRPAGHPVSAALALMVIGLLLGSTACSSEPTKPKALNGIVREKPLDVGDVELPEVTTGVPSGTLLRMKPEPGHLIVAYFGYTFCPDVCPTTLAALRRAYRNIGAEADRIDTVMVTVDPRRDTADVLNTYLSSFFSDHYHAVRTLDMAELKHAQDAFLASSTVLYPAVGEPQVSHTGTTYLIDDTGTVRLEWPFGLDAAAITSDLRTMLSRTATT